MVNLSVILLGAATSVAFIAPSLAAPTPNPPSSESLSARNEPSHNQAQPRSIRNQPYLNGFRREVTSTSDGFGARDGFSADTELLAARNRLVGKIVGKVVRGVRKVFKSETVRDLASQGGQQIFDAGMQRVTNRIANGGQPQPVYRREHYSFDDYLRARFMELDELD